MKENQSEPNAGIVLFTIGFTGKTAERFFTLLQTAGVKQLIDTRLNNVSQLAGFTKRRDLEYFLKVIGGIQYRHDVDLAPTADILDGYKKGQLTWEEYENRFDQLLLQRAPASTKKTSEFDRACLLCSEAEPDHCHRRLVAEYLKREWREVSIQHL